MQFKKVTLFGLVSALASSVIAHSWAECTKTYDITNIEEARRNVDAPLYQKCAGYPRNKVNNGDWIAESSNYLYDLNRAGADGKACHPTQRSPVQAPGTPAATARPGEVLKIRHWGNGHSDWHRGSPLHQDPGLVRVYWAGGKEREIVNQADLTGEKIIAEGNFSANAIIANGDGLRIFEKGNYLDLTLPANMEPGRHMMVWTWASIYNKFTDRWTDRYTTCFDVIVVGGNGKAAPAPAAPVKAPSQDNNRGGAAGAKAKAQCAKACNRGGMAEFACTGGNCPPCRYAVAGGSDVINCFEYGQDGACPWKGGYDCAKSVPI